MLVCRAISNSTTPQHQHFFGSRPLAFLKRYPPKEGSLKNSLFGSRCLDCSLVILLLLIFLLTPLLPVAIFCMIRMR